MREQCREESLGNDCRGKRTLRKLEKLLRVLWSSALACTKRECGSKAWELGHVHVKVKTVLLRKKKPRTER